MSSFLIEDWMMSDGLKLKGCELFLYALIHSYTKAGKTMFESEQSLGERFGYSRRNVGRALESLRRRGLIIRRNKHPGRQSYDYCCDISSQLMYILLYEKRYIYLCQKLYKQSYLLQ